jgi:hypothetical protein
VRDAPYLSSPGKHQVPHTRIVCAYRVALFAALGLCLIGGAQSASAEGLSTEDDAKLAEKCQSELGKQSTKVLTDTLASLDKCSLRILACFLKDARCRQPPGLSAPCDCIVKATARRECALDALRSVAAFDTRVKRKCGNRKATLAAAEILGSDGLGFERVAGDCETTFDRDIVPDGGDLNFVSNQAAVRSCSSDALQRGAALLFSGERPRARELLVDRGKLASTGMLDDLLELSGLALDAPGGGKLQRDVLACNKRLAKVGRTFVKKAFDQIQRCLQDVFACEQTEPYKKRPRLARCYDEARDACERRKATIFDAGTTLLKDVLETTCAFVPFDTLRSESAANLLALSCECAAVGEPVIESLEDFARCLLKQHECRLRDLVPFAVPRVDELLATVGRELGDFICTPDGGGGVPEAPAGSRQARGAADGFRGPIGGVSGPSGSGDAYDGSRRPTSDMTGVEDVSVGKPARSRKNTKADLRYRRGICTGAPMLLVTQQRPGGQLLADGGFELALPPDPPQGVTTESCGLEGCETEVSIFYNNVGVCNFDLAFAIGCDDGATVSPYVTVGQEPVFPASGTGALVMPFDATDGHASFQMVHRIGDSLNGAPVVAHMVYWAEDGSQLSEVFVCLAPDDTIVMDAIHVQGQVQAGSPPHNLGIGPIIDLSGERGIVVVTAFEGDNGPNGLGCNVLDVEATLEESISGNWSILDFSSGARLNGEAIGLFTDALDDPFVLVDEGLRLQSLNPQDLSDSDVILIGLETAAGNGAFEFSEHGPIRRTDPSFLSGAAICCSATFFDDLGQGTSLPDVCFNSGASFPISDLQAGPGELGIIPPGAVPDSPGVLQLNQCQTLTSDGFPDDIGADFEQFLFAFHGQGPFGTVATGKYVGSFLPESSPVHPTGTLVMPFDATVGHESRLLVSTTGDLPGDRIATHWSYWATDGRLLADVLVCMAPNDTVVMDATAVRDGTQSASDCCEANGSPACQDSPCTTCVCAVDPYCCNVDWDQICAGEALDPSDCGGSCPCGNVDSGPTFNLTGERGVVVVTAFEADTGPDGLGCLVLDVEAVLEEVVFGSWAITNSNTPSGFGGDAIGLETGFLPDADSLAAGVSFSSYNPQSLSDSEVILIALETSNGTGPFVDSEIAPVRRRAAGLGGFSVCCGASYVNDLGLRTRLPNVCLEGGTGFFPITDLVAEPGEVALIPPTLSSATASPGFVRLTNCQSATSDGGVDLLGADLEQYLFTFHGQRIN